MNSDHTIGEYEIKGANDEEPNGDCVNDANIGEGGEEEDGAGKEEYSSHDIVDTIEDSPGQVIFV